MERYFDVNNGKHSIRCKIYCNDIHDINRIVLFGHGFGGHKDNKAAEKFAIRILSKYKSLALVTFNLPSHGDDVKKKLTLADCNEYIEAVLSYLKETYNPNYINLYATSFGGYLFLKYIYEHGNPFNKVALRCPAVKMYKTLTRNIASDEDIKKLSKGKDIEVGFDRKIKINQDFLDELEANDITKLDFIDYADDIIIIHGTKDEVVDIDIAREFAENNVIEFVAVENADHRFQNPKCMDIAMQCIIDFYGF